MYRVAPPSRELQPYVQHYWFLHVTGLAAPIVREAIHVDGCAELVFNFGDAYDRAGAAEGAARSTRRRSNLDGPRLEAIRIEQAGTIALVGVRFHPGGLRPFVDRPVTEFFGHAVPLDALGDATWTDLEAALAERHPDAARQAALLDRVLLARLHRSGAAVDQQVWFNHAAEQLAAIGSGARVRRVAQAMGVSVRSLERRVHEQAGVSPTALARIGRFRRALRLIGSAPMTSLSRLAAAAGFADQAHLTREFRALAGETPARYRAYLATRREAPPPNLVAFVQDEQGPRW